MEHVPLTEWIRTVNICWNMSPSIYGNKSCETWSSCKNILRPCYFLKELYCVHRGTNQKDLRPAFTGFQFVLQVTWWAIRLHEAGTVQDWYTPSRLHLPFRWKWPDLMVKWQTSLEAIIKILALFFLLTLQNSDSCVSDEISQNDSFIGLLSALYANSVSDFLTWSSRCSLMRLQSKIDQACVLLGAELLKRATVQLVKSQAWNEGV